MLASEHNAQMWQVFHKLVCTVDLTVYGVTVESPSSKVKKAIFNYRRSTIGLLQAKFLAEGFVHLEHCFLSCPPFDRPRFNVAFESWGGGDSKVALNHAWSNNGHFQKQYSKLTHVPARSFEQEGMHIWNVVSQTDRYLTVYCLILPFNHGEGRFKGGIKPYTVK